MAPSFPSKDKFASSAFSSSMSSCQFSIISPTWSLRLVEEAKKRKSAGSPTTRPNSWHGNLYFNSLLHTKRHYTQVFDRRGKSRYRGHGGFDADVIGVGCTSANPNSLTKAGQTVGSGPVSYGKVEVCFFQNLERFSSLVLDPGVQDFDKPLLKKLCLKNTAIKQEWPWDE